MCWISSLKDSMSHGSFVTVSYSGRCRWCTDGELGWISVDVKLLPWFLQLPSAGDVIKNPRSSLANSVHQFRHTQRACHHSAREEAMAWVEVFASALVFSVWVSMLSNLMFLVELMALAAKYWQLMLQLARWKLAEVCLPILQSQLPVTV